MKFLWFVVIALALFGPKLGPMDVTVIGGVLGLSIVALNGRLRVPSEVGTLLAVFLIITMYALTVSIFAGIDDFYIPLRQLRAALTLAFLGITFYNARLAPVTFLNLLILALLLNVFAIGIQIAIPDSKAVFAQLWEFDKGFVPLQAFGLTAGYDAAGYMCIMGACLSVAAMYYSTRRLRYFLSFTLFIVATLFTSRNNIAMAIVLLFTVSFACLLRGKGVLRAIGAGYLVACAYVSYAYILPVFIATIPFLDFLEFTSALDTNLISYSRHSGEILLTAESWYFPLNVHEIAFGTGMNPRTDIGYVKLVHLIGVVGLTLVMFFYGGLLLRGVKLRAVLRSMSGRDAMALRTLNVSFIVLIAFTFVINLKSLYFFTRGFHEFWIILLFSILAAVRLVDRNQTTAGPITARVQ
jgi:hypothetical protein